jgi:hypothetical protein
VRIEDYGFIGDLQTRRVGCRDGNFRQACSHLTLTGATAAIAEAERATSRVAA